MSYASVTASNVSPDSPQPRPDPALLNTTPPAPDNSTEETAKVRVIVPSPRQDPHGSQEAIPNNHDNDGHVPKLDDGKNHRRSKAVVEGRHVWEAAKHYLLYSGMGRGCVGLVNIGLLIGFGRVLYTKPNLRRDATFIASAVATAVGVVSTEAYVAERYRPGGKEAEYQGRDRAPIHRRLREAAILRPGMLSGLVGIANTAVVGALGYLAYINWDRPQWDRRTISSISLGLIALFSGEAVLL